VATSFFFNKIVFGLLSVFIPLYLVSSSNMGLGGTLVDLGIMLSAALLFTIPASFFWGYICDRTKRTNPFILFSFLSSAALILGIFTLASNIILFIVLYVVFVHTLRIV
jgi:cyanate permease